jgi:hypothetical protein
MHSSSPSAKDPASPRSTRGGRCWCPISEEAARRWPGTSAAAALGLGAVFAFPLQVGAACLGALTVLRTAPGGLSRTSVGLALAVADVAVEILVDGQGAVGPGGETGGLNGVLRGQCIVYQAQGMTMVDLQVTLVEALARLRAFAFAQGAFRRGRRS